MKRKLLVLLLLSAVSLSFAQPQQSANFKITKSVIDGGGGASTSTNFRLTSAYGQPTPVGAGSSSNFVLYSGFLSPSFSPGSLNPIDDLVIQRVGITNDVKLTWNPISGATAYQIYRAGNSGFVPSGANQIGSATDTTYTDVGVVATAPTQLFYIVTASAGALLLTPINPQMQAVQTQKEIVPVSQAPVKNPEITPVVKTENTSKQITPLPTTKSRTK
jgi:hypothetical protein